MYSIYSINMSSWGVVIFIGVLATLVNSQYVVIDTSTCTSLANTVNSCVTANTLNGIETQTTDSVQTFYISLQPSTYCSIENKANFTNLVDCIITAYRACAVGEFKTLLAVGDSYKEAVEEICEHKDDFNPTCTNSANSCASVKFGDEGLTQPDKTTPFSGHKDFYCKYVSIYKSCVESDSQLSNCAQTKTRETMLDLFGKIAPPACGSGTAMIFNLILVVVSLISTIYGL